MQFQVQRRPHAIAFAFLLPRRIIRGAADIRARCAIADIAGEGRKLSRRVVGVIRRAQEPENVQEEVPTLLRKLSVGEV